ncbi:MAG TPA: hypothetical protein VJ225_06765, partial [Nitrososphaeraceae archaeon]|nr:hypothetical protein [Nitrososphaeraceae archaeon]
MLTKLIPIDGQSIYSHLIKKIIGYPRNALTNVETPDEILVGSFAEISATFQGSVKDSFITCEIVDCMGESNWCDDKTTVHNLGYGRQFGILNFKNKKQIFKWLIRAQKYLDFLMINALRYWFKNQSTLLKSNLPLL